MSALPPLVPLSSSLPCTTPVNLHSDRSTVQGAADRKALGEHLWKAVDHVFKHIDCPPPTPSRHIKIVQQGNYAVLNISQRIVALTTQDIKSCIGIGVRGFNSENACINLGLAHLDVSGSPAYEMLKKMADRGATQIKGLITGGYADTCDKGDEESLISKVFESVKAFEKAYPEVTLQLTEELNPYKVTPEYQEHENEMDYLGLTLDLSVDTSGIFSHLKGASPQYRPREIELLKPFTAENGIDNLNQLTRHPDLAELVDLLFRVLKAKSFGTSQRQYDLLDVADKFSALLFITEIRTDRDFQNESSNTSMPSHTSAKNG